MITNTLDRYILREWGKIFAATVIGFPLLVSLFELTDSLDRYLMRGLGPAKIALGYAYAFPDKIFLIIPAAVLFATVFCLGAMNRHSELTATKASGVSVYRVLWPVLAAATAAAAVDFVVGELAPPATRRQLEVLGEAEVRSTTARHNFVYRAEEGWAYAVQRLEVGRRMMQDVVLEREGTGPGYPTLAVQASRALYDDSLHRWTLSRGRFRILAGDVEQVTVAFDSMRMRSLVEPPAALTVEPKKPQEMRYGELGRYVEALERSGGNGRQLRVERALKIAVPFTCIVIAIFAAPLALAAPRASGATGVAISLVTTVIFLVLVQLSEAVGAGGLLPPLLAAWMPNLVFGGIGLVLMARAPT